MTDERRTRVLTDDDIAELMRRIDAADEARWTRRCESLGYNISTPENRAAIYADHAWVRAMRTGTDRATKAGLGALGIAFLVGFGRLIWDLISIGAQVTLKAKGGG